ncbi:RNase III domain-containing protein [Poronia punctata]|nr:RNase III domain-containing protein [Poronia punctata]
MAFKTPRSTASLSKQAIKHYRNRNAASVIAPLTSTSASSKSFATSTSRSSSSPSTTDLPRWSYTPERMKAPFSPHIPKDPQRTIWKVNDDPEKLDQAMDTFLGHDGRRMLPEELKWLAVTHKSFDQGRRGFNDRLAFLGRQMCTLEAMQSIIHSEAKYDSLESDAYADMREPFDDPALRSLDNLAVTQPTQVLPMARLATLAMDTGISEVVRWKPRLPENLAASGIESIMTSAIYAIVGAIALQHGAKVAHRVIRERIMKRLRA